MTLIATYILNAGLNFVVGLLIGSALGPAEFGRYALAISVVSLLASLLFEGLRFSTIRFYSERVRSDTPAIRATLAAGHAFLALVLLCLAALCVLLGLKIDPFSSVLFAAMTATVLGQSLFEYHAALARSRFKQWIFLRLTLIKSIAALCLGIGAAFYFRDSVMVLVGLAISAMLGVAAVRRSLADPQAEWRFARLDLVRKFALYPAPLIAANSIYTLTIFVDRTWLASNYDLHEVGQFSLAWDVGFRLFLVAGSALDTFFFQVAVRAEELGSLAHGEHRVASNVTLILVLLLPGAAGFWMLLPTIQALIIPAAYHGSFIDYSKITVPAFLAFSLIQFALSPVFQLRKRTTPVIVAAAVALAVNCLSLLVLPHWYGAISVALAQLLGITAALAVLGFLTLFGRDAIPISWRDVVLSIMATAAMICAIAPLRHIQTPLVALAATMTVGAAVYGGLAWLMNLASIRVLLERFVSRLMAVSQSLRST